MPHVLDEVFVGVWDVRDVEDPQAGLPVCSVDVSPTEARVVGIFSRPGLHGHVMDVDPTAQSGLPTYFSLTYLDNSRQVTIASEVQVGNSDAPASIALTDVTGFVVRVGDEDVPLVVYHVSVEVVRPTWVVDVVPRINKTRISLVGDIH